MWQRFSERARKVVFYAQEEAQKYGEGYVSTEHLLLGLLREEDSTGCLVIEHLGVSLRRVRVEVDRQLPRGDARPSQDMTLTPRAKRVIDLAYEEARNLRDNFIGTEHLLLGIIREGDGLAGRVLDKLGVELEAAREMVVSVREARPEDPPPPHYDFRPTVPSPSHTGQPLDTSRIPPTRQVGFLMGASLQEHLMLALIAENGKAAEIIKAQVGHVSALQWALWQEIARYANYGAKRTYPQMLPTILELAKKEAKGGEVRSEHLLLTLLDPDWKAYRFGVLLEEAGLSLKRSRELI